MSQPQSAQSAQNATDPHRAPAAQPSQVAILALDFESVPDAEQLAAEYARGGDFKTARSLAHLPDGLDRVKELLGDACKPGNRKGDTLVAYIDNMEQTWETDICKTLSVDPLRCALCSVAIYTEATSTSPDAGPDPRGFAFVASWGVDESREGVTDETVLGRATEVTRLRCIDGAPKSLTEMTWEEQHAAERRLLLWTWQVLAPYAQAFATRQAVLTTYNGGRFDIRALLMRSMMHAEPLRAPSGELLDGARPTVSLATPRYATRPHLDVMSVLTNWESNNYMSLEVAMSRMKAPFLKPDGWNGAAVYPAALEGNWEGIEAYNLPDAATLYAPAARLIRGGLA